MTWDEFDISTRILHSTVGVHVQHNKLRVKSLEHMLTEANCFISRTIVAPAHSHEAAQIYLRHQRASQGLCYTCVNHANPILCTLIVCRVLVVMLKLDKPTLLARG